MSLLQIIFLQTSSCAITQFLTSYDVWKDFIVPIGIAVFAGIMAYLIFVKETRRDKEKEQQAEKQLQQDKLTYFSNLVKNVISISEQQNASVLAFVKEQRKDPCGVKQLLLFSMNELRRVTADLQLESYMLAYVNYYNTNRQLAIKEFNNIIIRIDMLHGTFKAIEPHLQLVQEDERNAKLKFSNYNSGTSGLVAALSLRLSNSAPKLAEEMDRITAAFYRAEIKNRDMQFCYNDFLNPLNSFAAKYVTANLPEAPHIQELALLTRDGKAVYEQLISHNQGLADEFQDHYERLKPEIEKLKEHAKRLLEDFGG